MILFIGKGFLGKPFYEELLRRQEHDIRMYGRETIRLWCGNLLQEHDRIWNLRRADDGEEVTTIINCAGFVQARTERDPVGAAAINLGAVVALCKICEQRKIKLIHISTEYVFGGEPIFRPWAAYDTPCPSRNCYYGVLKAEADRQVRRVHSHLILRPAVLPEPFPYRYAFDNVIASKISVAKAVERMGEAVAADTRGVLHVCGKPQSIYDYVRSTGQDVEPIPATDEWLATHPGYTAMEGDVL